MCFFRLNEGQQAIITVFGKPREEALTEPGLKFRLPWWNVHFFDKRILRWDGDASSPLNTAEQTFIYVDTTARWKIVDPLKFYTSVKTTQQARLRLDDIIDSVVRAHVSKNALIELVRDSNRTPEINPDASENEELNWSNVEVGRGTIMGSIIEEARPNLSGDMGIELIDVRIKRLKYIESVEQSIFDRMIAERKRIAQKYRSEGEGERANIIGSMERKLREIQSEANRKALEVEGQADAEATKIYAEAYNRDPEFYAFMRTLESYRDTLGNKTTFVTTTDSEYFQTLKETENYAQGPGR
jgi:membrane protease subunit HflC